MFISIASQRTTCLEVPWRLVGDALPENVIEILFAAIAPVTATHDGTVIGAALPAPLNDDELRRHGGDEEVAALEQFRGARDAGNTLRKSESRCTEVDRGDLLGVGVEGDADP